MLKLTNFFFASCSNEKDTIRLHYSIISLQQPYGVFKKFILHTMTAPTDRPVIKGTIADYWFDDGILVSLSKSPQRTVANITENVALVQKITGNKRVPLLIYLCNSPVPDKETRRFATTQLPVIYSAMAMVSKPGLSQFIMKILFALRPPPIPMKSFTSAAAAKEWLQQFVAAEN